MIIIKVFGSKVEYKNIFMTPENHIEKLRLDLVIFVLIVFIR